ncbi:MAG: ABC-F family ATP-binding cassette domain-containing protein, partial [Spirochaetales bacterium]|nr:ABC-F family ATP-binding cassette domain-containing protein [Spirochaetales bacterium]
MAFVQLSGISLAFGEREILKDVNLTVSGESRAALTGANGSGKTTLMKIIAGAGIPDAGNVNFQRNTRVSYLPQSGVVDSGLTLWEEAEKAFEPLRRELEETHVLERALSSVTQESPETARLLETLSYHQEHLVRSGYYSRSEKIGQVLQGLGFSLRDKDKRTSDFSGGWQMRIALCRTLLEDADILLLDEPTNYLDIEARGWLESYLSSFAGGLLVVSHDKYFLDVTVREVLEIFSGRLTRYAGNFSAYQTRRQEELAGLMEAYRRQEEEIARQEEFIRRFRANASRAALVQSRAKQLEKMTRIEVPDSLKRLRFSFPPPPHSGRRALSVEGLSKSYGALRVFSGLGFELGRGERLVVAGKNGAGKSTLLRILAGLDKDFSGSLAWGAGVKTAYFSQDADSSLDEELSVVEEVEAACPTALFPKIRTMLGAFLFQGDDIYKSVSVLSGGERSRLCLLKMLLVPANLLILDEPTNHLDMSSKDVLLDALKGFDGALVFVSHDRYFIEGLATKVLEMREGLSPRLFPGGYEYYLFRLSQEEAAPPSVSASAAVSASLSQASREEQKKRKSLHKKLTLREEEILTRIAELEAAHKKIGEDMARPGVYADGAKMKALT